MSSQSPLLPRPWLAALAVCLSWLAPVTASYAANTAPTAMPENTILFDRIESRPVFGGLGGGNGPIGGITEFYIEAYDHAKPLLSLGGDVASNYPNHMAVPRMNETGEPMLCSMSADSKVKAVCHPFPEYKQLGPTLEKFSLKNREHFNQTLRYVVPFTATELGPMGERDAQGYYSGLDVKLSNWVNGHENVRVRFVWPYRYKLGQEPSSDFHKQAYLFQSNDDPKLFVCPANMFDSRCYTCVDCDSKALKPYAATPQHTTER